MCVLFYFIQLQSSSSISWHFDLLCLMLGFFCSCSCSSHCEFHNNVRQLSSSSEHDPLLFSVEKDKRETEEEKKWNLLLKKTRAFHLQCYISKNIHQRNLACLTSERTNTAYLFRRESVRLGQVLTLLSFPLFTPLVWSWIQRKMNRSDVTAWMLTWRTHSNQKFVQNIKLINISNWLFCWNCRRFIGP